MRDPESGRPIDQNAAGTRLRLKAADGALIAVVVVVYALMIPWESEDIRLYFLPWLGEFIEHGPTAPLAGHFSNYSPAYLYLMSLGSRAVGVIPPILVLKLISVAGNLFMAFGVYSVVRVFRDARTSFRAAVLSLILPTVALNGPLWGQCDAIYTGAILFGVAAALENRSLAMLTAFGVAFSFKLQAVFLAPFLLYQVLRQRPPAWLLLVPPAVFAGLMLPAWFSGRPAMELLTLYLHQANLNPALSVNAPNPWLAARKLGLSYEVGAPIGVGLAAVACLALALTAHRARLDRSGSLLLALGSAVILPYLLPNMHDRYFFVADVLSLVLAYAAPGPRTIAAAVLIQAGSLGAYLNYLFDVSGGAMAGMLLMSAGVAVVVHQIAGAFTVAPAVQYRPGRG